MDQFIAVDIGKWAFLLNLPSEPKAFLKNGVVDVGHMPEITQSVYDLSTGGVTLGTHCESYGVSAGVPTMSMRQRYQSNEPMVHGLVTSLKASKEKTKVEFWHPRKGGWYLGTLVKQGKKFVTVRVLGATRGILIPVQDVREAKRG